MPSCISSSPEETRRIGREWGEAARPGWVIGLVGDLGAGKTELVKGIAEGLGFSGLVQSPTFSLVHEYAGGRELLYHLDLYRLKDASEVVGAGLEEYLVRPPGVTVVEWADRWAGEDPAPAGQVGFLIRWVQMEWMSDQERRVSYEDFGP